MSDLSRRRVVVTGLGAVSGIGADTEQFLAGLRAGRSAAKPITAFDTKGFEHSQGCQIDDFDPAKWMVNLDPAQLGRAAQFSVAATRMAVADAGLDGPALRERSCLVSIGTTDGEAQEWDELAELRTRDGLEKMDLTAAGRVAAGRLSALVAGELGLSRRVESATLGTACSSGNYAIGYGFDAVSMGDVDIALCGGVESMGRLAFAGFYRLGAVSPDVCRPFDPDRQGILGGEGGGVLVLESLDSALARGARIHAEVLGYGLNCDASHPTAPDMEGVAECMRLALDNAGVNPEDVDFISAHGTGTKANDYAESVAISRVFGTGAAPRTTSIKSMLGHSMGASSALASIGCVMAITEGFIPPTINHAVTDPDCPVDVVANQAADAQPRIVQNNGLAFGGNNAVVLYGRYEERPEHRAPRPATVNPVITAWSVQSPMGKGQDEFAAGLHSGRRAVAKLDPSCWETPLHEAGLVPGFDIREELGRKGTRSMDRRTGLAVVAVKSLLEDAEGGRLDGVGPQTALVLGTNTMPVQGILDFGRDTWIGEKPYHVDAGQFAAMVMNSAAAQCAIWHRLTGPNATVAAGRAAGLVALQYALRLHGAGRAETVLCGAAMEFSEARAWMECRSRTDSDPAPVLGEGAAVWLLESPGSAQEHGRPVLAEIAGLEFGFAAEEGEVVPVLADCVRRLLDRCGAAAEDVWAVVDSGAAGSLGTAERTAVTGVFPEGGPRRIDWTGLVGDMDCASGAFQIGVLLAHAGSAEAAGRAALVTSVDKDGVVGCALLRM